MICKLVVNIASRQVFGRECGLVSRTAAGNRLGGGCGGGDFTSLS